MKPKTPIAEILKNNPEMINEGNFALQQFSRVFFEKANSVDKEKSNKPPVQ